MPSSHAAADPARRGIIAQDDDPFSESATVNMASILIRLIEPRRA